MKQLNAILTFHETGNCTTLWTEQIPLNELGQLEISRASTIEFNANFQVWEVRFSNSKDVVYANQSRAACIAWEIEALNGKV
jgi:hypothetical protein